MMTSLIGASLSRPDALGKVTIATAYPGDLIRPGMLQLQVVLPIAHMHASVRLMRALPCASPA